MLTGQKHCCSLVLPVPEVTPSLGQAVQTPSSKYQFWAHTHTPLLTVPPEHLTTQAAALVLPARLVWPAGQDWQALVAVSSQLLAVHLQSVSAPESAAQAET